MRYNLKGGYIERSAPAYFQDTMPDGMVWQPDVYPIAAFLARLLQRHTLIDIGCGRAYKLVAYGDEFNLIGIDTGTNIRHCQAHHPKHKWVAANLEKRPVTFSDEILSDSVVICADVIEHLINPVPLLATLYAATLAAPVLISTPDRLRLYGHDHDGPPTNEHHVREWTLPEFLGMMDSAKIDVTWAGYTASQNRTRPKNTLLILSGIDQTAAQSVENAFEVEPYG